MTVYWAFFFIVVAWLLNDWLLCSLNSIDSFPNKWIAKFACKWISANKWVNATLWHVLQYTRKLNQLAACLQKIYQNCPDINGARFSLNQPANFKWQHKTTLSHTQNEMLAYFFEMFQLCKKRILECETDDTLLNGVRVKRWQFTFLKT